MENGEIISCSSNKVFLESSDKVIFETNFEVVSCSNLIKTILSQNVVQLEEAISLPNIKSVTLERVLIWANHHKDDPVSSEDKDEERDESMSPWDEQFIDVTKETILDLILAANYLDIGGLLDITCKAIARLMNGRTPEELRETFNVRNYVSPAERELV